MRLATRMALAACLLPLFVAALSGCGGSTSTSGGDTGTAADAGAKVVDVYSSLPMHGPSASAASAIVDGIRLALAQADARAGTFSVHYTALDDSDGDGWDASRTAADARRVAGDPRAVYYVGEFDDGASEVSMPILNDAGIPQVSATNTYVGLTRKGPGTTTNEPRQYWPTGTRTYLRIVPTDMVQGAAVLLAMKQAGCTRVAVADDAEPYGAGIARLVALENAGYDLDLVSTTRIDLAGRRARSDATRTQAGRSDCLLLAGVASRAAVRLTEKLHAAAPAARIFAPSAMCTSAWTNPRDGGVLSAIDPLIECTAMTRSLTSYPGGQKFLAAYKAAYPGASPSPYAILGYEAMMLGLSTIARLGPNGDSKSAVRSALFSTTNRHSALGTYDFDSDGDTTLRSYGLYRVGRSGDPVFLRTITPAQVL
jgi:branched-chain amino acid transport system substrate-binding protein